MHHCLLVQMPREVVSLDYKLALQCPHYFTEVDDTANTAVMNSLGRYRVTCNCANHRMFKVRASAGVYSYRLVATELRASYRRPFGGSIQRHTFSIECAAELTISPLPPNI